MERLFGLIGYPLGHSFSEKYFSEKFRTEGIADAAYRNFPIGNIDMLPGVLASHPQLQGFNVTIPYKETVIPYLAELDSDAAAIGAVNCVKKEAGGLKGYNTDAYGFERTLLELIGAQRPRALVMGTGGASKAVGFVLRRLGVPFKVVSRSAGADLTYKDITPAVLAAHKLIVNTTPLGTYPKTEEAPDLPYGALGEGHFLYDLVYNPPETLFLREGRTRGALTMNGYRMLVAQAEKSWEIWNREA